MFDRALENRRSSSFVTRTSPARPSWPELEQQYQKTIAGDDFVTFRGKELHAGTDGRRFLKRQTGLSARKPGSWPPTGGLEDREATLRRSSFDQMKPLRIEIAHEAGFANFVEYASPQSEAVQTTALPIRSSFHEAVERVVVPLMRQIQEKHKPCASKWNLSGHGTRRSTRSGRPPLVPFQGYVEQLGVGTETIFREVNPELRRTFAFLSSERAQVARSG